MPVYYNLNVIEKREVLVVILQIIRNLDDTTLIKAWQQSIAGTRLFFKLLEECITHFEVCTITLGSLDCCSICQCYQLLYLNVISDIITLTSKTSVHKMFLTGCKISSMVCKLLSGDWLEYIWIQLFFVAFLLDVFTHSNLNEHTYLSTGGIIAW